MGLPRVEAKGRPRKADHSEECGHPPEGDGQSLGRVLQYNSAGQLSSPLKSGR